MPIQLIVLCILFVLALLVLWLLDGYATHVGRPAEMAPAWWRLGMPAAAFALVVTGAGDLLWRMFFAVVAAIAS